MEEEYFWGKIALRVRRLAARGIIASFKEFSLGGTRLKILTQKSKVQYTPANFSSYWSYCRAQISVQISDRAIVTEATSPVEVLTTSLSLEYSMGPLK